MSAGGGDKRSADAKNGSGNFSLPDSGRSSDQAGKAFGVGEVTQGSLWSIKPIRDTERRKSEPLDRHPVSFSVLTPLWQSKNAESRLSAEEVSALHDVVDSLSTAIEGRLAAHYKLTRKAALQHPSDVASYLTLREIDDKATADVPRHRLQAIDFGVKALLVDTKTAGR